MGAEGKYTKGYGHVKRNNPIHRAAPGQNANNARDCERFQVSCHGFWQRVREHPNRTGLPRYISPADVVSVPCEALENGQATDRRIEW